MSKRKINLEEIIKYESNSAMWHWFNEADYRKDFVKNMMIEFGKQLLELAAENARTEKKMMKMIRTYVVNKQSILDTIKQIE